MKAELAKKNEDYYYIWIDSKINNNENSKYSGILSKTYTNIHYFTNIKDAIILFQKIKFNLTYIIVSGTFFVEFISRLKNIENEISTVPKIIIFTSESIKSKLITLKEINDSFYNIGGLSVSFVEVQSFLNKKKKIYK